MRMVVVVNFAVVWIAWHIFLVRIPAAEATQIDLKSKWFDVVIQMQFRMSRKLARVAIPNPFSI